MDELNRLRKEIDEIDRQLVPLFESRMEKAVMIGRYKGGNNISILDPDREKEVIEKALNNLKNSAFEGPLKEFFINLMKISKEVQL